MRRYRAALAAAAWLVLLCTVLGCSEGEPDAAQRYLVEGREHLRASRPREAIASFEKALAARPDVPTLLSLAQLHATLSEWDRVERYLERARALAPLSQEVQLGFIDVAIARGDLETVRTLARGLSDRLPMEPEPRLLLGALAEGVEQSRAARRELTAWRNRTKGELQVRELATVDGALARSIGAIAEARAQFRRARQLPAGDPGRCTRLARIYLARKHWAPAELLLEGAAKRTVIARSLWLMLAGAAVEAQDYKAAQTALENAKRTRLKHDKAKPVELIILQARVALGLGRAQEAHDLLDRTLARGGAGADAVATSRLHYWLGRALVDLGRVEEARRHYEASEAPDASHAAAQVELAELELAGEKAELARLRLERLVASGASAPVDAFELLARLQLRSDAADAAEKTLRRGLAQHPHAVALWVSLARLLKDDGREQSAMAAVEQALVADPANLEALGMKALAAQRSGEADSAIEYYERILEVRPGFAPALNNLAYVHAEQRNDLERALQLAEQARVAAPEDALVADTLGWVLYRRGDHERAQALFREALRGAPDHPEPHYHLGALLLAQGKTAEGRAALRKALSLSDSFAGAAEARRLLEPTP